MSDAMRRVAALPIHRPGDAIGYDHREQVRAFFASHIGCTNIECGKAIGLSVYSVGRHIAKLRKEWVDD